MSDTVKKILTVLAALVVFSPALAFASPVQVDRIIDHIQPLKVTDYIKAQFFTATSTTGHSTFPYASTTVTSATRFCLIGDICISTWPTGGGSGGSGTATTSFTATTPIQVNTSVSAIAYSILAASASQTGSLSAADFQLLHTATTTFTSPLVYTASTNAVTCPTCGVGGIGDPFTHATPSFGTTTSATTSSLLTQGAFFASSTKQASQFPYASSTALTAGNLFVTGSVTLPFGSSGAVGIPTCNGTGVGGPCSSIGPGADDTIIKSSGGGSAFSVGSINLASANAVGSSILPAANGGTGSSTLSGILRGNGTGIVQTLLIGSNLTFDGTTLSASGGGGISDPFTHPAVGVSATTSGLSISASSTIGDSTRTGGLTISGGATSTFAGSASIPNLFTVFNTAALAGQEAGISLGGYQNAVFHQIVTKLNSGGATGDLIFRNGKGTLTELARFAGVTGFFGIGTSTPGSALSVQGNQFIAGNITSTSTVASVLPYASSTAITTGNIFATIVNAITSFFTPTTTALPAGTASQIAVNTTSASSSLQFGSTAVYATTSVSFTFSTSTPSTAATDTVPIVLGPRGSKFTTLGCKTFGGTANIQIGNGTASSSMEISSTGVVTPTTLSTNNTFDSFGTLFVAIGTYSANTVSYVSCGLGKESTY